MDQPQDAPEVDEDEVQDEQESQLPLSEDEQQVLELYDQLQQLRLEIAIINAQSARRLVPELSSSATNVSPETQKELLDARANFRLRNDAVESVMTVNPILKAVHHGTNASPAERDLLPYIEQREQSANSVMKHATDVGFIRNDLTEVQGDASRAIRKNVELTSALLKLAEEVKQKQAARLDDDEIQTEIRQLEADMKLSRQRWRVIKGVASGVVAGSGVDWSRDATLREVVLDLDGDD
ncbi:uncharacterized protein UV8b_02066 [Ustilaginoidea virens]|uniref:Centromere protein H C-terminal domain-containing protein n=1 Tax=Ustilaginoidea virens TaxID=1159556 RepID=A0A8E5HLT4_USTVR|nr:uncharacterized protein UV8b_02066 [Ustilaginoidea virens]QUC17825.1 hypothetical protein UV8b_02066 [Ustilaginoidea virens]